MPIYEYRALRKDGKTKTGILDADTPKDARNKLRAEGIHVVSLVEIQGSRKVRRFLPSFLVRHNVADLAMVTRQLATLLESGIQLREGLGALIDQIEDRHLQTTFRDIREKITGGKAFAEALAEHPLYFNDLYVNMVKAGEAAGTLDNILNKLADYLQMQNRMQGKISAALAYPVVMIFIGTGVVIFLMTFVVPKIIEVLKSQNKTPPLPTQILVAISGFMVSWWFLLLGGAIGLYILFRFVVATHWGKRRYHSFLLSLPVLGQLFRKQSVSRFAITFSTLLRSGIPALDCLKILRDIVDNIIMAETVDEVAHTIMEGGDIATTLRKSKVFPPLVGYMIAIGEKSGRLEPILAKIAEAYDEEIEVTTQKVTSLLEPILIVGLAAVVGFIVLSIVLPIMDMGRI